ncbi:interferon-inducible GTPase 5-like isoform X2 [Ambystoma mexicanum]|uniref:interferon-inducible GTPase 5-like isoform X2 n=1 Tax=Ambystoma mexicanum TaxID=8296 RepID=UPI0037E741F2
MESVCQTLEKQQIIHVEMEQDILDCHPDDYDIISDEELKQFKTAIEEGDLSEAAAKLMESLDLIENAKLDIAITGESGSGKSTFVNAIRGVEDEDEGSAETGVVETTMAPTPYPHPQHQNVTVWDLPGIGTEIFQSVFYLKQVCFERYDFFIIIATERFKSNHAKLAREIHKMGKKFYFVRSKVDADLDASKRRRKSTYDEKKIMQQIRDNCIECLKKEGVESPRVYLLSCFELNKYDFGLLEDTLEKELPSHKRHTFLLSLPNISINILEKKKELMKKQIWKVASMSCAIAAVPVPGLSIACDLILLKNCLSHYCKSFGVDEESVEKLARKVDMPVADLKSVIESPLPKEITNDLLIKLLAGSTVFGVASATEELMRFIPMFGSVVSGGISFGTTYYMLNKFLNDVAEDAQRLLRKSMLGTTV